jgi:hypothetical protein
MNQDGIVQPPIQFPGGTSIADQSIATESLASELSKHPIRFGCLSHTTGGADTARVWTACTVTPSQIRFQGWISHFATSEPDFQRDYARHVQNIHDATNLEENLETLKRALIVLAYGREHPIGGTQRPDDELDNLAAGKAAAVLQEICAGASMPNSVRVTRFAPSHPHFTTVASGVRVMTEPGIEKSNMPSPENKKLLARTKATMDASDGKEILERKPVWVNPDGTVLSIRDASPRHLVAEAKLAAEKLDHRRQARGAEQRRYRSKKSQDGNRADIATSAGTLHSPALSEQTSSSMAAHFQHNPTAAFVGMLPQQAPHNSLDDLNGPHGIPKQNSQKLQRHRSRPANSSGKATGSRGLFPLPESNKSLNSGVSHNKLTASRTLQRSPGYRQVPDATTQTSTPCRSDGRLSPSFVDWSQHQNYAAAPYRLPSSTFDPQTLGQYLQASDLPELDTTVLPHRPADYTPNSNYQVTSTNFGPSPFTVPHNNSPYPMPQEQTYQPSLYHNSTFDPGEAGSVPHIGSPNQFGRSISTQALLDCDLAGRMMNNSNHADQEKVFSEDEINSALSNTARPTPASQSFSGWNVNISGSNNPPIFLIPAAIASGHLFENDPAFDWENQSW